MEKEYTTRIAYPDNKVKLQLKMEHDPNSSDAHHPNGEIFAYKYAPDVNFYFASGDYAFTMGELILRIQHLKSANRMQYAFMGDLELKTESVYDSVGFSRAIFDFDVMGDGGVTWDEEWFSLLWGVFYQHRITREIHQSSKHPIIFGKDIRFVTVTLKKITASYLGPISER